MQLSTQINQVDSIEGIPIFSIKESNSIMKNLEYPIEENTNNEISDKDDNKSEIKVKKLKPMTFK